jgi:hypothetical protein
VPLSRGCGPAHSARVKRQSEVPAEAQDSSLSASLVSGAQDDENFFLRSPLTHRTSLYSVLESEGTKPTTQERRRSSEGEQRSKGKQVRLTFACFQLPFGSCYRFHTLVEPVRLPKGSLTLLQVVFSCSQVSELLLEAHKLVQPPKQWRTGDNKLRFTSLWHRSSGRSETQN